MKEYYLFASVFDSVEKQQNYLAENRNPLDILYSTGTTIIEAADLDEAVALSQVRNSV